MSELIFGEPRSGVFDVREGWDGSEEISLDVPTGVEFAEGEWVTRDANRVAGRIATGVMPEMAFPVVTGAERSDYKGSGSVTVRMGPGYQAFTDHYDPDGVYSAGVKLTVKGIGAGAASRGLLTPVTAPTDPVFAICLSGVKYYLQASDELTFPGDTVPAPVDQLGRAAKTVIEIQVIR